MGRPLEEDDGCYGGPVAEQPGSGVPSKLDDIFRSPDEADIYSRHHRLLDRFDRIVEESQRAADALEAVADTLQRLSKKLKKRKQ